ncbi:alpha/beta fold hydrolase [Streptomyces sp. NPDC001339]|uniref:alpha/beta fold hydrolase n=1 Tax=Streptomyces sp. NPDC001339 TaxID=3364563 RepID=UPI0036CFB988
MDVEATRPLSGRQNLSVRLGGHNIKYVDFGGDGVPLVALHGAFGRGAIFAGLAEELGSRVRVIAPDQRGHGLSDHTDSYTREDFVEDAVRFVEHLGVAPVVVLGHSLGGITAYQLAARRPDLVRALIVEDVGPVMCRPEIAEPVLDVRGWPMRAATRAQLARAIEHAGAPDSGYFMQSAVAVADPGRQGQWRMLFDWDEMMAVQESGLGDWWSDWLASECPALVLHGGRSPLLPGELAREMTARRPHTRLVEFPDAGHWVHDDEQTGMARAVIDFLDDTDDFPVPPGHPGSRATPHSGS